MAFGRHFGQCQSQIELADPIDLRLGCFVDRLVDDGSIADANARLVTGAAARRLGGLRRFLVSAAGGGTGRLGRCRDVGRGTGCLLSTGDGAVIAHVRAAD